MTYEDPYDNPFVLEREDGTEIAEAESLDAMKDAARHLIEIGEELPPLTVRARHSGMTYQALVDSNDHVWFLY